MASRKGIHIYIPKYFMAVRNCMNIFVIRGLEVLHFTDTSNIRTFYVYVHVRFF